MVLLIILWKKMRYKICLLPWDLKNSTSDSERNKGARIWYWFYNDVFYLFLKTLFRIVKKIWPEILVRNMLYLMRSKIGPGRDTLSRSFFDFPRSWNNVEFFHSVENYEWIIFNTRYVRFREFRRIEDIPVHEKNDLKVDQNAFFNTVW